MRTRIGINGLGRSGRQALKAILQRYPDTLEVVAANDLGDPATVAWLFAHDSNYGPYPGEVGLESAVESRGTTMVVDGRPIALSQEPDPAKLRWGEMGVEIVLESVGIFTHREKATLHVEAGAHKVVIGAPSPDADLTVVLGANHGLYDPQQHHVLSMGSCTTNCVVPMIKVLLDEYGVARAMLTTVHAYTNQQNLLDAPHKDLRRARAAALNIIPTTTGAAHATGQVLPALEGKLHGMSIRVPTPTVSLSDVVVELERATELDAVVAAYERAAAGPMAGILSVSHQPYVSSDLKGDTHSCIVDAPATALLGGHLLKVLAWYDNEWGYSNRLADLCSYIAYGEWDRNA
jgi:glyceraldehyde 3-phosphate dehydrogenase